MESTELVVDQRSKGGYARAEALTAEERKAIARKAAMSRWDAGVPQAEHEGDFQIGGQVVSAAVLLNGKRLLTQATLLRAIGRARSPKAGTGVLATVDELPFFLQAEVLNPFIDDKLRESTTPIFYREKSGKRAVGYDAQLLPDVAKVYLKYRNALAEKGKLVPSKYKHIIRACDAIIHSLANVGIAALVDEATGYQDVQNRQALQEILDQYLQREFAAWAKTFPDEFYRHIFRLRGWKWMGMSKNRPQCVANYTKDLIYARLAPGIVKELELRNPIGPNGRRKGKHFQLLTEDIGNPALAQHMHATLGLMRACDSWPDFMRMMNRSFPPRGDTLQLPLFTDDQLEGDG